ncbi:MAG: hypothetical protein ACR2NJ_04770, partial [Acidimicrobiales bacterium]
HQGRLDASSQTLGSVAGAPGLPREAVRRRRDGEPGNPRGRRHPCGLRFLVDDDGSSPIERSHHQHPDHWHPSDPPSIGVPEPTVARRGPRPAAGAGAHGCCRVVVGDGHGERDCHKPPVLGPASG